MRRAGLRRFLDSLLIGLQLGADKSISGQTLTGNSVIVSIELVAVAGGTAGCLVERLSLPLSSEISAIPVGTEWVVAKRMITLPCQLHTNTPQPEGSSTARSMILRMHVLMQREHN